MLNVPDLSDYGLFESGSGVTLEKLMDPGVSATPSAISVTTAVLERWKELPSAESKFQTISIR